MNLGPFVKLLIASTSSGWVWFQLGGFAYRWTGERYEAF